MAMDNYEQPMTHLKGVGAALAQKLAKLGLHQLQDCLFHFPLRYEDRTRVVPLSALQRGESAMVVAQIDKASVQFGRRRSLMVTLSDDQTKLKLRFFHFNAAQHKAMHSDSWMVAFGEVRPGSQGLEMVHPEYRISKAYPEDVESDTLTAIYPTTEGVSSARIRALMDQAHSFLNMDDVVDCLPPAVLAQHGLLPLADCLRSIHQPNDSAHAEALSAGTHPAYQRLALEELLAHHLALRAHKLKRQHKRAPVVPEICDLWQRMQAGLAFKLTAAQLRVISEIKTDLRAGKASLRLVQGDVGSGKTVVAAAAALMVVDAGLQVAIMAPTELLAEQHRASFSAWCAPLGLNVAWLASKQSASQRRESLAAIANGEAQIIVGTHAVFQDSVCFEALGLVVVDEQHRFGVNQRLALKQKGDRDGFEAHQIIMSATPIPRSLSMVFYADIDVSSIDELPPGRQPITTHVLSNERREEVIERMAEACRSGKQAYWVCSLIDESDHLQAQAATDTYELLTERLAPSRVGLVHGRMKAAEKDTVMKAFRAHDLDLLVATTVIEVGVDVPNATLMVIENSERLGLAQLHQLRGRVGRGDQQSSCLLMYQAPLGKISKARLQILRDSNDGFEIAQKDLEQRGPGELMGTRQTGEQRLKVANLVRDQHLLPQVHAVANQLTEDFPDVIPKLLVRWVPKEQSYAKV